MQLDVFVRPPALCGGSAVLNHSHLPTALAFLTLLFGCGADAEERYAGLTRRDVSADDLGYRVRFLAPPWSELKEDPLATGARTNVTIGGQTREVLVGTGLALVVERESSLDGPNELFYAKYKLEAVGIRCNADELAAGLSCAELLAEREYEARSAAEQVDYFGTRARQSRNDFGQPFYELMTRDPKAGRFRRFAYFVTAEPELALRVYVDANPELNDVETTRMIKAVQLLEGEP